MSCVHMRLGECQSAQYQYEHPYIMLKVSHMYACSQVFVFYFRIHIRDYKYAHIHVCEYTYVHTFALVHSFKILIYISYFVFYVL